MPAVPASSNLNIYVPVRSEHPITGAVNISTYAVDVAVTTGVPTTPDWFVAVWETGTRTIGGNAYYLARLEIGPNSGTVTLVRGETYQVHARVTTATDRPVVYSGGITAH